LISMESSLWFRPRLYRKAALGVICACLAAAALSQYAKKAPSTKGPRALAVLEVTANGKAHLIPVTIMVDGKFYDAGAYKADPVPMALQSGTVYEGLKTGDSQGLFTISGALHDNKNAWLADGTWRSNAQIEADKARTKAAQEKLSQKAPEVEHGPPRLKRGAPTPEKPAASAGSADKTSSATSGSSPSSSAPPSKNTSPDSGPDPDRPVLRRQAASESASEQTKSESGVQPLKGPIEFIPAISDAGGAEPRPYKYAMKPDEEQARLKKMSEIASEEVGSRAGGEMATRSDKNVRLTQAVQLQDVQMHVFDLSNSNEPVIVLMANGKVPSAVRDLTYITTVVAREDIYGDLHKVFAQTTDNQRLDVLPRYDLIDAVDADGDGRGELLFRMIWESGSAFSVYRVIGDRLWALFEGKPGS
jgi:hypothetical protein